MGGGVLGALQPKNFCMEPRAQSLFLLEAWTKMMIFAKWSPKVGRQRYESCGSFPWEFCYERAKVIQSPNPRLQMGNKSQQSLHNARVCPRGHPQDDR